MTEGESRRHPVMLRVSRSIQKMTAERFNDAKNKAPDYSARLLRALAQRAQREVRHHGMEG